MYKGTLTLFGGTCCGDSDAFHYNGIIEEKLTFVVTGDTPDTVREKLLKVLPNVKGVAFDGASDNYIRDLASLPVLAGERLDNQSFHFNLDYDDYDDLVAGASWKLERNDGNHVIILQ